MVPNSSVNNYFSSIKVQTEMAYPIMWPIFLTIIYIKTEFRKQMQGSMSLKAKWTKTHYISADEESSQQTMLIMWYELMVSKPYLITSEHAPLLWQYLPMQISCLPCMYTWSVYFDSSLKMQGSPGVRNTTNKINSIQDKRLTYIISLDFMRENETVFISFSQKLHVMIFCEGIQSCWTSVHFIKLE